MSSVDEIYSRVVVSGLNNKGQSTIVDDTYTRSRAATGPFTINRTWQLDSVPCRANNEGNLEGEYSLEPPKNGLNVITVAFPPDSELAGQAFDSAFSDAGAAEAEVRDSDTPGLHVTQTLDVVAVVYGEIYAVLEDTETLLRQGDTFIQRRTKHTWSNRSNHTTLLVASMIASTE